MLEKIHNLPKKVVSYLLLGRIGMSPLTISVPIIGVLAITDISISTQHYFLLGLLGLSCHLFGFALNDIIDYPIDKTVDYRKNSPLVSGALNKTEAWGFVILQLPIIYFIYLIGLNGNFLGTLILSISIISSVVYNLWSKRGFVSRFMAEASLALSVGLLAVAAVSLYAYPFQTGVLLVPLSLFLILLSVNSISSGLKDLKTDYEAGAQSFIISVGAKMHDDNLVKIPAVLHWYANFLQLLISFTLVAAAFYFQLAWFYILIIGVLCLYATVHINQMLRKTTFSDLMIKPLLNGYFNYIALTVIVINKMPSVWWVAVIFFSLYPLISYLQTIKKDVL